MHTQWTLKPDCQRGRDYSVSVKQWSPLSAFMFLKAQSALVYAICSVVYHQKKSYWVCACMCSNWFFPRYLPGCRIAYFVGKIKSQCWGISRCKYGSENSSTGGNQIWDADILNQCPLWKIKINFSDSKVWENNWARKQKGPGVFLS